MVVLRKYIKAAAILVVFLLLASSAFSQISYGGRPLLAKKSGLRSSASIPYISMPPFNLDSVLRTRSSEADFRQRTHTFAYKFYTDIDIKEATEPILTDNGMRVWQLGIRSENALSINLLFTQYRLPEGARLFIYSNDYNQIIGKFDHRNNSSLDMLPVRPLFGESVIVEYAEPMDAEFEGEIVIGEVNHGYDDFLLGSQPGREPAADVYTRYRCMPDALCVDEIDEEIVRSVVLLIINGESACTGVMVNNTAEDRTPYLLTAVHCLTSDPSFSEDPEYYIDKAGTIVTFFNYHRVVCGSDMKATEEMSMAIAHPRVIMGRKDIALLELNEKPPVNYNAYYAGWDMQGEATQTPYMNIHQPYAGVKKYGRADESLSLTDYKINTSLFESKAFWEVDGWTVGSTYEGASGSPLYNNEYRVVGTLTGGNSDCAGSNPDGDADYFAALYRGWNNLSEYLDPLETGELAIAGLDPHKENPLYRISNADYNNGDALITSKLPEPDEGYVFGNSTKPAYEFAEEFNLESTSEVRGVYVFIPDMLYTYTQGVEIVIYKGESYPEELLVSTDFIPQYLGYQNENFELNNKLTGLVPTETFVDFGEPVPVDKKFFVVYRVSPSDTKQFTVYNTAFASSSTRNTAWIKQDGEWIEASAYAPFAQKTSLALQPLIRYNSDIKIDEPDSEKEAIPILYDRASRTMVLSSQWAERVEITVYSVTGQLLEKLLLPQGEKSIILREQRAGTVGIVKIRGQNSIHAGKIIY